MALKHTPAHTTEHPDRFEDEMTGFGYSVLHDVDAERPRVSTGDERVAVYAYRGPRGHADPVPENVAAQAFDRFFQAYVAERSITLTKRYLAAFHPEKRIGVAIETIHGYGQGDWLDVFAAASYGEGGPEEHIDRFRMWAFGDVWVVVPDGKPGVGGIYADGPEKALAYYRETFEDTVFERSITLRIRADDEHQADTIAQLVVGMIDHTDSIAPVVTASLAPAAHDREERLSMEDQNRPLRDVTLVYVDKNGNKHEQSLADLTDVGTLIDPDDGDDLELVSAKISPPGSSAGAGATDLDPHQAVMGALRVTWEIDSDEDVSPARAAVEAWQRNFRRGSHQPGNEECCVFTVADGYRRVTVDLSDDRFSFLFPAREAHH